jgi:tryptophan synthase alpha chain
MIKNSRISGVFQKKKGKKVMSLFITAGFPELDSTPELILALEKAGADIIELGMPFSDPLADGPTIQISSEVSIQNGTTLDLIFNQVSEIRKYSEIPIVLMGYINPILYYGLELFFKKAAESGVDGFILPDVPVEESALVEGYCRNNDMALIYLVAPNTTDQRMKTIDEKSEGFVYCVSVTGVTGARDGNKVASSVAGFIDRVKSNIQKNPVLVGFGIKSHDDAMLISQDLDGFVVGSALIDTINKHYPNSDWMEQTSEFVKKIKNG